MPNQGWFRKRAKIARDNFESLPQGLWSKCTSCAEIIFAKELEKNLKVCTKCGYHFRLSASERIEQLADPDTFEEFAAELRTVDVLHFPEYGDQLAKGTAKTSRNDALVTGRCKIEGQDAVLGVADFGFMGGSMGSVVGEKIVRAAEVSLETRHPLILVNASGGARMQEGILSLMQMAKTSAAIAQLERAGILYISVLTDPTMAGVHASFASIGDIIIAEPAALIGFAGQRVSQQAQVVKPPAGFQTAEFQLENGMIDMVVPRRELKSTLGWLLSFAAEGELVAA